ncbi:hypothetical protein L204_105021 [Cryptococcus depauperatus]|nr:hypothetical protein L204_03664 [Cryptococcus depauperatus CBS 7855]
MDTQYITKRARYLSAILFGLYCLVLGLLAVPAIQREFLFLHHVPMPLFPDFANPEKYGLAPFKTRNFKLNTFDGESIGAWHLLPRSTYTFLNPLPPQSALEEDIFKQALVDRPTVIYLHGNAGSRATSHRVRGYSAFSNHLDCNVIAIDYRGYADSSGIPTEEGLVLDAKAALDYVSDTVGAEQIGEKVILVGQSLGTWAASGLAGLLANQGIAPRAITLIAPFSSVAKLLTSFRLFKFIPLLGPLGRFPPIQRYLQSFLIYPFDSSFVLTNVTSPILLLHAANDDIIPHTHSSYLFQSLISPYIKNSIGTDIMQEVDYPGWGVIRSFERKGKGEVVWWEGKEGGHNRLGWAEGTLDLIARVSGL